MAASAARTPSPDPEFDRILDLLSMLLLQGDRHWLLEDLSALLEHRVKWAMEKHCPGGYRRAG